MIMSVNVKITKSENFEINFENKIENNKSEKLSGSILPGLCVD